jgi:hypothetical protein
MIEVLEGFGDNIAAYACHGHVTKADYETVLIPDTGYRGKTETARKGADLL